MKTECYIILNKNGVARLNKERQPSLSPGERAVRLLIDYPDKAFLPQGIPTVTLTVPEELLLKPTPMPSVAVLPPEAPKGVK